MTVSSFNNRNEICIPFQICLGEDIQQFNDITILHCNIIQRQVRRRWFVSSKTVVNNRTLTEIETHPILCRPVLELFKNSWQSRLSVSATLFNKCKVINIFEAVNGIFCLRATRGYCRATRCLRQERKSASHEWRWPWIP